MNPADYCKRSFLFAIILTTLSNPATAQYRAPVAMPRLNSAQLMQDQRKLPALRGYYQQYKGQVDMYVEDCQARAAAADNQIQQYEKQRLMLDRKISDNPKQVSASKAELSKLRALLQQQELLKQQITENVNTALTWLRYLAAQVNNAEHDVTEDQQQLTDAAVRFQQARAEEAWQYQLQEMEAEKNARARRLRR